ncbi:MAG: hypothetical protein KAT43_03460 [Nanoarchaeota archaeon]|nr:hypothetical protein [Nanoarchaeota archaeon]
MKLKLLRPDQIITTRDYPVFNLHILVIFFRIFNKGQGKILPPCPVLHISSGIPYVRGKDPRSRRYNNLLSKYLEKNPKVKYFLIDGGHKTSAAAFARKLIPAMVMENDKDFAKVRKLKAKGEFFGYHSPSKTIKESIRQCARHHLGTTKFLTVEDKVKKMIQQKDVPEYMIKCYRKK